MCGLLFSVTSLSKKLYMREAQYFYRRGSKDSAKLNEVPTSRSYSESEFAPRSPKRGALLMMVNPLGWATPEAGPGGSAARDHDCISFYSDAK